jgi:uncharacterized protein YbjT (DUF2867 family)
MTVLIVGATGQLGTATARRLVQAGRSVRALVRPDSKYSHLAGAVELAYGDLADAGSLERACSNVEAVIATASAIVPRRGDSFSRVEDVGYRNLLAACRQCNVGQLVFISVPVTPWDALVPTFRTKRMIEQRLFDGAVPFTVFRSAYFMDQYLASIGSSLPLRGAEGATLRRPFWFTRLSTAALGNAIERLGLAVVPGSGRVRHCFVAIDDVAAFLARAVGDQRALNAIFDIGGPTALSWDDLVDIYARILGRRVRAVHVPARLLRGLQQVLTPLSPAAANLLGVQWIGATVDMAFDAAAAADRFGVSLTSVEDFLRAKLRVNE